MGIVERLVKSHLGSDPTVEQPRTCALHGKEEWAVCFKPLVLGEVLVKLVNTIKLSVDGELVSLPALDVRICKSKGEAERLYLEAKVAERVKSGL